MNNCRTKRREARKIIEDALAIHTLPGRFIVHHIDSDEQNNLDENLMVLLGKDAHNKLHANVGFDSDLIYFDGRKIKEPNYLSSCKEKIRIYFLHNFLGW